MVVSADLYGVLCFDTVDFRAVFVLATAGTSWNIDTSVTSRSTTTWTFCVTSIRRDWKAQVWFMVLEEYWWGVLGWGRCTLSPFCTLCYHVLCIYRFHDVDLWLHWCFSIPCCNCHCDAVTVTVRHIPLQQLLYGSVFFVQFFFPPSATTVQFWILRILNLN